MSLNPTKIAMNLNVDNLRLHMRGVAVFVKHNVVNSDLAPGYIDVQPVAFS
jgi:hypothetical protein